MTDNEYDKLDKLPWGNTPSIKSIMTLGLTRKNAKLIKLVMQARIDLTLFDSACKRIQECYNYPDRLDVSLHVISDLMSSELYDTYGIEYIRSKQDSMYESLGIEYINRGDTYDTTILFDHNRQRFYISSWGDIVESNMNFYE